MFGSERGMVGLDWGDLLDQKMCGLFP
jgi:hypothetical protein